jgi:hypothetical protein
VSLSEIKCERSDAGHRGRVCVPSRPAERGLIHPALAKGKKAAGAMVHRQAGKTTDEKKAGGIRTDRQGYNLLSPTNARELRPLTSLRSLVFVPQPLGPGWVSRRHVIDVMWLAGVRYVALAQPLPKASPDAGGKPQACSNTQFFVGRRKERLPVSAPR